MSWRERWRPRRLNMTEPGKVRWRAIRTTEWPPTKRSELAPVTDLLAVRRHIEKILKEAGDHPPTLLEIHLGMIEGYRRSGFRITGKQIRTAYADVDKNLKPRVGRPKGAIRPK
jgi:hypothetical protein